MIGVIALVKSALTNEKIPLPEDFSILEAAKISKKHRIESLIYYGAVNCGIPKDDPVMKKLFRSVCAALFVSENQLREIERVFLSFEENSIEYMPLKGLVLKELYPKKDMRSMSDADVLICVEQYPKIKEIMLSLGFSEKIESDHELIWESPLLTLELHKRLIPSYNEDFFAYFGDGWQLAKKSNENKTRYEMSKEDEYIYLLTHFAKHYRDGGVGIKHVADFFVFLQNFSQIDRNYTAVQLDKLHLSFFEENVMKTLDFWFGNGKEDDRVDLITSVVFNSGAYGTYENHLIAQATKESKILGSAKKARRKEYMNLVFMPYSSMCKRYPVLIKAKILLPVFWFFRGIEALFNRRKMISAHYNDVRYKTDDRVSEYKQMLDFVGLSFNFSDDQ